jgi:putative peptidoglycan lipid II flippase
MVERLFKLLHRELTGIHQAALLLGFSALASQLLALLRDRLLAFKFGAGVELDMYYAAFRIPDFIFVSIGSLVSLSVLIPFLLERLDRSPAEAKKFLSDIFSIFFAVMVVVNVAAFFLVPKLLPWLFPSYVGTQFYPELIMMTRILLLSPIFLGFSNFLASVTQAHRRFALYSLSPVLYNAGIIIGVVWLYPLFGLTGLTWGVVLGAMLHFLIQVPFVLSHGLWPQLSWRINFSAIKKVLLLSLPRTITLSANELTELFLISLASVLTVGSVSVFNFAFNLQGLPLSVIGVSYSLAAFPTLTKLFGNGDHDKFVQQMVSSAQHIIFWTLPLTVLFVVLRAQIVRTVLGSGHFDWADTRLTAAALALFVVSLVPQSLSLLFVRAYYSRGQTWKPLLINALSAVTIITASYALVKLFQAHELFRYVVTSLLKVDDVAGAVVLMLPLAFSIGLLLNLLVHWLAFRHDYPQFSGPVRRTFWQSFAAAVIGGFVAYLSLQVFNLFLSINTFWGIFLQGLFAGILGLAVHVLILRLLGSQELVDIWQALHRRFWGSAVIGPDPDLT